MPSPESIIAARFLRHSFKDIDFDYEQLTAAEQKLCTREEFATLRVWIAEWAGS